MKNTLKHVFSQLGSVALLVLAGCASPEPAQAPVTKAPDQPATTVILLPDEDGKVGAVTLKTQDDSTQITQAYQLVSAMKESTRLATPQQLTAAQVQQGYAKVLKAQPGKPFSFLLYFSAGAELTPQSQAAIAQIVDKIRDRMPTEVFVIGHTDSTGTEEANTRISRERATTVQKLLKSSMPSLDRMTIQSFGSKDLLVPTGPDVNEPRNRRVEVVIL